MFCDITGQSDNVDSFYLDDTDTVVMFDELCGRLTDKGIYYYKVESEAEMRRVLHKDSARTLKATPRIDFTLFKNEDNTKKYAEQLFKIYKNSTVKENDIKEILISIISDNETVLRLDDFQLGLTRALITVDEVDYIKKNRNTIVKLNDEIENYNNAITIEHERKANIRKIYNNRSDIESFISTNLSDETNKLAKLNNSLTLISSEQKSKENAIRQMISNTQLKKNTIQEDKRYYEEKLNIKQLLIEEESLESFIKESEDKTNTISAMSTDIENIESAIKYRKSEVQEELNQRKDEEQNKLNEKKDELNSSLQKVYKEKSTLLETKTEDLKKEIERSINLQNEGNVKAAQITGEINLLENKEITNNTIKSIREKQKELDDRYINYSKLLNDAKSLSDTKKTQRNDKIKTLQEQREKTELTYTDNINSINQKIKDLENKLDMGKSNLFGFINSNDLENKNKILSVVGEKFLFLENLTFNVKDESNTLFGLEVNGDYESLSEIYDTNTLKSALGEARQNRSVIITNYKIDIAFIDKSISDTESNSTKALKELAREISIHDSNVLNAARGKERAKQELEREIEEEKERVKQSIIEKREAEEKNNDSLLKIKKNIDEVKLSLESIKRNIEEKANEDIKKINSSLAALKDTALGIQEKYTALRKEKFLAIDKEFEEQKISKGVDVNKLASLKTEVGDLSKKIQKIKDNSVHTIKYRESFLPSLAMIPELIQTLNELDIEMNETALKYRGLISEAKKELSESIVKKEQYEDYQREFKKFIDDTKEFTFLIEHTIDYMSEEEIFNIITSKKYKTYLNEYKDALSNINEFKNTIENLTKRLCQNIKQENMLNLKTTNGMDIVNASDINSYIDIARDYIKFLKEDLDIEGLSMQVKSLNEIINSAYSTIKHIKSDIDSISSEINKVNRMLRDSITSISVIDEIKLNYNACGTDDIVMMIEALGLKLEKEFHLLFTRNESSQVEIDKMIKIARDLKSVLESNSSRKYINVSDLSILSFDVGQNGITNRGITDLGSTGSNGTKGMIRTILYLTLLKKVSSKVSYLNNITLHCILDEIGSISADYFAELLVYAEQLGFNFVNGTASNDDDTIICYKTVYTGISKDGKSRMYETINKSVF